MGKPKPLAEGLVREQLVSSLRFTEACPSCTHPGSLLHPQLPRMLLLGNSRPPEVTSPTTTAQHHLVRLPREGRPCLSGYPPPVAGKRARPPEETAPTGTLVPSGVSYPLVGLPLTGTPSEATEGVGGTLVSSSGGSPLFCTSSSLVGVWPTALESDASSFVSSCASVSRFFSAPSAGVVTSSSLGGKISSSCPLAEPAANTSIAMPTTTNTYLVPRTLTPHSFIS